MSGNLAKLFRGVNVNDDGRLMIGQGRIPHGRAIDPNERPVTNRHRLSGSDNESKVCLTQGLHQTQFADRLALGDQFRRRCIDFLATEVVQFQALHDRVLATGGSAREG